MSLIAVVNITDSSMTAICPQEQTTEAIVESDKK